MYNVNNGVFIVKETKIKIKEGEEYITLQSLLKVTGVIDTGGMAKAYLATEKVLVNNELENRRGRKLYNGDVVETGGLKVLVVR